jgi:hypothetical protein
MTEVGSAVEFDVFARSCRALVDDYVFREEVPAILVADGPDFDAPILLDWHLEGTPPPREEVVDRLVPAWIEQSGGSQIAVSVPFREPRPGVSLLIVDEGDWAFEHAYLDVARLRLEAWQDVGGRNALALTDWQATLAQNAGWRDYAKWRCRRCQSVCGGEAEDPPTPCSFCESTEVERVALETALRPPASPWGSSLLERMLGALGQAGGG